MCEREEAFSEGELRNNNQQGGMLADGDANANDIQTGDGGRTGDSGLITETAEQDKVIIWGTDSQCDDPDLAEFEMLECQELEAYLVEEDEDFVGLAERKELQERPSTCRKPAVEEATDNKSRGERTLVLNGACEQESSASHVSESRDASRTELSSETDVFVSCLSTVSSMATALDTVGKAQTTDSWHAASGPHSTISEDLTSQICTSISERGKASQRADDSSFFARKSTIPQKDVDVNSNSAVRSEDAVSQVQDVSDKHRMNNNLRNGAGCCVSDVNCTEHKALTFPTKCHKEINTKIDKSTQADETADVNYTAARTGTKGTQSCAEPKAMKKQGSFDNTLKKQSSFDRSLKKQPSFENTLKKQSSFENSVTCSSSLEGRKPWGSPSRPATPTSPKTTSSSPKRRPPGSPAKVQGIRALSLERGDSSQRGVSQTVKPPTKTSLSSGIPKPVAPQQKESEPRRTSPTPKPKNVRPKIITYVRKNTQANPQDALNEDSTQASRSSSYSNPPALKDPQPKSAPLLSSSNALFDRYRQEMQKAGYLPPGVSVTGIKPPSSTIPLRSGKSDGFHEAPEKYLHEVRTQLFVSSHVFYKF